MTEPEALARGDCPFPLDTHDVLRQFGIIRVLLDVFRAKRNLQNWQLLIVDSHGKVADPYGTFQDSSYADVPVVGVVNEDTSAGLKASQRLTPAAASAGGDVAELPRIIPGAILVGTEHNVVVSAVPLTWSPFRFLRTSPFLSDFRVLEPASPKV